MGSEMCIRDRFYGMLVGTAVGLIVIPLLYILFQTMREATYNWRQDK